MNNKQQPISGVYVIKTPNQEYYIGESGDIDQRYKQHQRDPDSAFYPSFQKHGIDAHELIILAEMESGRVAFEKEVLKEYLKAGLNVLNPNKSGGSGEPKRRVACYTKSGAYINQFESVAEASRRMGVLGISQAIHGRIKTAGGYKWVTATEED